MFTINSSKCYLLLLFTFLLLGCGEQAGSAKRVIEPIHVDALTMSEVTLRLSTELPGRISAFKNAEVRPQVTGIIESRLFEEGAEVKAGEVLYQIDPVIYQASVNSYQAQLQKAVADQLSTKKSIVRYTSLLKKNLTSQQNYDDAYSANQQALAEVAIRQAALDNASVLLSYTQIKAPISGRIGLSQVSEGSLVTAQQDTNLASIIQSNQVYVDMTQSSVTLYAQQQEFQGSLENAEKPPVIPVKITLEDGSEYDQLGYLEFSDVRVDNSTGSVTLRALVANEKHRLLPGMFVRATISAPKEKQYIVIPQSLVVRTQSGEPTAYVINSDNQVKRVDLILGNEVDNGWVVKKGLAVGDNVVMSNLSKIKANQTVVIDSENVVYKINIADKVTQ
ncbi:MAG: membrane fusion protein (multidrug efflux system) [Psychromonas sp.]|jgi:membrane fusion protein (multidrug efflux system)|uniref:efflux RND transporter periplasmic adaptor subunit n=1 Tax=Psychromonas sp. TaxID=1884585 RepID=UPI0039E5D2E2